MENFENNLNGQPKKVTSADIAEAKKAEGIKLYQVPGSNSLVSEEEKKEIMKEKLDAGINSPES